MSGTLNNVVNTHREEEYKIQTRLTVDTRCVASRLDAMLGSERKSEDREKQTRRFINSLMAEIQWNYIY